LIAEIAKTRASNMTEMFGSFARRSRTQRGFSLLQLLFVVAIVGIISAIALPSFVNTSRPYRLRNDAHALASLITMARMRASVEFAHVEVSCTTNTTPATCILESSQFPNATSFVVGSEPQKIYLSSGVSFGIPTTITTPVRNQGVAYQGDLPQNTPTTTNTPVIVFNSRGLPVDALTGLIPTSDYVLYLKDTTGNYYAVSVNQTGHPSLYQWNSANLAFIPLPEYGNGG
jgi:prepilin-type N-terminal cleavage/methylation domain-containing protein